MCNNFKTKKNQAMRLNLDEMPRVRQGEAANNRSNAASLGTITEDIVDQINKYLEERNAEGSKLCY